MEAGQEPVVEQQEQEQQLVPQHLIIVPHHDHVYHAEHNQSEQNGEEQLLLASSVVDCKSEEEGGVTAISVDGHHDQPTIISTIVVDSQRLPPMPLVENVAKRRKTSLHECLQLEMEAMASSSMSLTPNGPVCVIVPAKSEKLPAAPDYVTMETISEIRVQNELFGFAYTLDAPTSGILRSGEDPLTYLNKDQFYTLTLAYYPTPEDHPRHVPIRPDVVVASVIMLQFRDRRPPDECVTAWEFWHSRQRTKLRVLDVDVRDSSGLLGGDISELANNAILVRWKPTIEPAKFQVAIRCLSTDFTSQKGVKGIPLHLQIDTYEEGTSSGILYDRAFCQIKTFCDKGAERKAREEEKKMSKVPGGPAVYNANVRSISTFITAMDLNTNPVLFTPRWWSKEDSAGKSVAGGAVGVNGAVSVNGAAGASGAVGANFALGPRVSVRAQLQTPRPNDSAVSHTLNGAAEVAPQTRVDQSNAEVQMICNDVLNDVHDVVPRDSGDPSSFLGMPGMIFDRVLIYIRQENEEVFTPLDVNPPSVVGLIRALCAKYDIDLNEVRYLFRRNPNGIVVRIDDITVQYYSNGDVFIMKVLAIEETSTGACVYDIVLADVTPGA